jgi:hypothetical protein
LADRVGTAAQKEDAALRKNAGAVVKRDPLNKDRCSAPANVPFCACCPVEAFGFRL